MTFLTEPNEKQTITISGVRENLNESDATGLMDILIANNIFLSKKGKLVSKHSAKVTERQVTLLEI